LHDCIVPRNAEAFGRDRLFVQFIFIMSFDTFIETAWSDHGDRPQEVADRLTGSLQIIETAAQIPPYARLLTHVFGEHLGQWNQGVAALESLRGLPAFDGSDAVTGAVVRGVAVLRYASGDQEALDTLACDDRVSVLATVSSALAARHQFKQAIAAYSEALALGRSGLPAGSPAIRALAVGGNNLASALEQKKDRDAPETAGMVAAAEGGLKYWKQAGTWLEEERANIGSRVPCCRQLNPDPPSKVPRVASRFATRTTRRRSSSSSGTPFSRSRSVPPGMSQRLPLRATVRGSCSSWSRRMNNNGASPTLQSSPRSRSVASSVGLVGVRWHRISC
jgi:hypothetical protein